MEQVRKMCDPKQFDQAVLESVDEGLSVLDENGRQLTYFHIESRYQIKREEICERAEAFDKALEGLFGAGAELIRGLIAKSIYERLGLSFKKHSSWRLVDYLDDAKKATRSR